MPSRGRAGNLKAGEKNGQHQDDEREPQQPRVQKNPSSNAAVLGPKRGAAHRTRSAAFVFVFCSWSSLNAKVQCDRLELATVGEEGIGNIRVEQSAALLGDDVADRCGRRRLAGSAAK